jgi:hypothetical protein
MGYSMLDPVVEPYVPQNRLAPRLDTLAGTRIGLWGNLKINTTELLDEVEAILRGSGVTSTAAMRWCSPTAIEAAARPAVC